MAPMIGYCETCGTQNFVSGERRAANVPPRCWKCGTELPRPVETGKGKGESNGYDGTAKPPGEERNA